jgi:hypothetical protein
LAGIVNLSCPSNDQAHLKGPVRHRLSIPSFAVEVLVVGLRVNAGMVNNAVPMI